jgi:hypothetical protein
LQFGGRALRLPIQNQTLFARKSRSNHAEAMDETLLTSSDNRHCSADLFQSARPGESRASTQCHRAQRASRQRQQNCRAALEIWRKMGGKVSQVSENTVHLSALTGAEYFDAFVDAKDISAVVVRVAGK